MNSRGLTTENQHFSLEYESGNTKTEKRQEKIIIPKEIEYRSFTEIMTCSPKCGTKFGNGSVGII